MFRCEICQSLSVPGAPCHRLAVKRRTRQYPYRPKANTFVRTSDTGKRKVHHTDDPGGQGMEIVQEILVCAACAKKNGQ